MSRPPELSDCDTAGGDFRNRIRLSAGTHVGFPTRPLAERAWLHPSRELNAESYEQYRRELNSAVGFISVHF
jgi:hypothetical protein